MSKESYVVAVAIGVGCIKHRFWQRQEYDTLISQQLVSAERREEAERIGKDNAIKHVHGLFPSSPLTIQDFHSLRVMPLLEWTTIEE